MRRYTALGTAIVLLITLLGSLTPGGAVPARAEGGRTTIFLPLLAGNPATPQPTPPPSGGGGNGGGGTGGQRATFWLPYTQDDQSVIATSAPSIAVDGRGGVHIVYKVAAAASHTDWPAYYMYCPASCDRPDNWGRVALGENVVDARVQVDAAGRPRLMIYAYATGEVYERRKIYQYAACDADCTDASSWRLTTLTTVMDTQYYRSDHVNRYFALDHRGRPAFVYDDTSDGHSGTFVASCAGAGAACNDLSAWNEEKISEGWLKWAELAFTPDNLPRIMLDFITSDGQVKLVYVECDETCAQFSGVALFDTDGHASWSLRLDRAGRPRAVVYTGWYVYNVEPQQILYLACDTNCATQAGWRTRNLRAASSSGWSVQLQLDAQDRPRFIYKQGDVAAGYAWCDADCLSEGSTWRSTQLESRDVLNDSFPVSPFRDCSISTWTSGHIPVLALDPQGNPRAAFVAKHQYSGVDTRPGHVGQTCGVSTDIKLARFTMFPQP